MGNRVMEAKRLKIKRMRRAYLQSPRYSANTTLIREFHGSARGLSDFERWFFNLTGPDDITLASQNARRAELGLPSGLARSSKEELQKKIRNFIEEPVKRSVVLVNAPDYKLMLFWTTGQHQFFFVKYDYVSMTFSKSIKYRSRDKAMRMMKLETILWVRKTSIVSA